MRLLSPNYRHDQSVEDDIHEGEPAWYEHDASDEKFRDTERKYRSAFTDICERFSKIPEDAGDEIDIRTGRIAVDRGHCVALPDVLDILELESCSDEEVIVIAEPPGDDVLNLLPGPDSIDFKSSKERVNEGCSRSVSPLRTCIDRKHMPAGMNDHDRPSEAAILRQFGPEGPAVLELLKERAQQQAESVMKVPVSTPCTVEPSKEDEEDDLMLLSADSPALESYSNLQLPRADMLDTPSPLSGRGPPHPSTGLLKATPKVTSRPRMQHSKVLSRDKAKNERQQLIHVKPRTPTTGNSTSIRKTSYENHSGSVAARHTAVAMSRHSPAITRSVPTCTRTHSAVVMARAASCSRRPPECRTCTIVFSTLEGLEKHQKETGHVTRRRQLVHGPGVSVQTPLSTDKQIERKKRLRVTRASCDKPPGLRKPLSVEIVSQDEDLAPASIPKRRKQLVFSDSDETIGGPSRPSTGLPSHADDTNDGPPDNAVRRDSTLLNLFSKKRQTSNLCSQEKTIASFNAYAGCPPEHGDVSNSLALEKDFDRTGSASPPIQSRPRRSRTLSIKNLETDLEQYEVKHQMREVPDSDIDPLSNTVSQESVLSRLSAVSKIPATPISRPELLTLPSNYRYKMYEPYGLLSTKAAKQKNTICKGTGCGEILCFDCSCDDVSMVSSQ